MPFQNPTLEAQANQGNAIAFIDSSIPDWQTLAAGIAAGTQVFILDAARDGVEQITQLLQTRQNIAALHIISHGRPGSVQLGNTWLNLENIETYALQLIQWRSAFTDNPDILLYGCNVAADLPSNTQVGNQFLQSLHHLTHANIAASKTPTGNAALGGNWEMEVKIGSISAPMAIAPSVRVAYSGVLAGDLIWAKGIGGSTLLGVMTSSSALRLG